MFIAAVASRKIAAVYSTALSLPAPTGLLKEHLKPLPNTSGKAQRSPKVSALTVVTSVPTMMVMSTVVVVTVTTPSMQA